MSKYLEHRVVPVDLQTLVDMLNIADYLDIGAMMDHLVDIIAKVVINDFDRFPARSVSSVLERLASLAARCRYALCWRPAVDGGVLQGRRWNPCIRWSDRSSDSPTCQAILSKSVQRSPAHNP